MRMAPYLSIRGSIIINWRMWKSDVAIEKTVLFCRHLDYLKLGKFAIYAILNLNLPICQFLHEFEPLPSHMTWRIDMTVSDSSDFKPSLGGGFKHFTPSWGRFPIFQVGWNHQPDHVGRAWSLTFHYVEDKASLKWNTHVVSLWNGQCTYYL